MGVVGPSSCEIAENRTARPIQIEGKHAKFSIPRMYSEPVFFSHVVTDMRGSSQSIRTLIR